MGRPRHLHGRARRARVRRARRPARRRAARRARHRGRVGGGGAGDARARSVERDAPRRRQRRRVDDQARRPPESRRSFSSEGVVIVEQTVPMVSSLTAPTGPVEGSLGDPGANAVAVDDRRPIEPSVLVIEVDLSGEAPNRAVTSATVASSRTSMTSDRVSTRTGRFLRPTCASQSCSSPHSWPQASASVQDRVGTFGMSFVGLSVRSRASAAPSVRDPLTSSRRDVDPELTARSASPSSSVKVVRDEAILRRYQLLLAPGDAPPFIID